uniref:Uncharacterized protein n=1 Tax=Anguilla anguilla TaxID=7936 RepID=A0A0E9X2C9_ANGAN
MSCTLLYDATRPWYNQAGGVNEFFCIIPAYEGVSDMEVLFKCVFIFTLGCQRINPSHSQCSTVATVCLESPLTAL